MSLQQLQSFMPVIAIAATCLALICLILAIVALAQVSGLKRKLNNWKDISTSSDLEEVFEQTQQAVKKANNRIDDIGIDIETIFARLGKKVSTPEMQRYNAFAEVGSDLSYSVALLDDHGDGVVLTSIYGRDDSVTYGKPVTGGESQYQLTGEEMEVIQRLRQPVSRKEKVTVT